MFIAALCGAAAWTAEVMVFEKFIRDAGLAVGLKPSATECEARLRGLERMMYSKTIIPILLDGIALAQLHTSTALQLSKALCGAVELWR